MRRGNVYTVAGILVLMIVCAIIIYKLPMNLGLDLQGGVHVVMEAQDTEEVKIDEQTMRKALTVIERRVNGLGVTEPVVQLQGRRRIIVELPGIRDQQKAIDVIGKTALLEFKDPQGNTVLTGADLVSAKLGRDQFGRPAVNIAFTDSGAKKFADLTARYVGLSMPVLLDGEVLTDPRISEEIRGGKAQITGSFTVERAQNLAVLLQAGSLPVPLDVLEIRNVGPILGEESIEMSLQAGVVGIVLVFIWMMFYYKLPGTVADFALVAYILSVLAIMIVLRATLTLPGIAGLILGIGMAVDANVIIFERIKDELRNGKRLRAAINDGFGRALRAIVDANVTTLITALVLFYFGTGPVRGFAVTLSIGILVSMFTAIVVTRSIMTVLVDADPDRFTQYFGVKGVAR